MLVHTKKHPIKHTNVLCLSEQGQVLQLPVSVARTLSKYAVKDITMVEKVKRQIKKALSIEPEEAFAEINVKYTKIGALLKAIRLREGLSQAQFAALISVE